MKNLFYVGLAFSSCAFVQFLSFIAQSYPIAASGANLVMCIILVGILSAGLIHWVKLKLNGYYGTDHLVIGFLPTIIMGALFILCKIGGIVLAL